MLPPTLLTAWVMTRTKNGPTIASNDKGTKNRNADVNNEPIASLNRRHPYATGPITSIVPARYNAATTIPAYNRPNRGE